MIYKDFIIKSEKLVTASDINKTIYSGAMVIGDGIIKDIGTFDYIIEQYKELELLDYSDFTVTPSLVDCHTHVLEYAPTSIFPVTKSSHLMGSVSLIFRSLESGITSLGEQICGHPESDFNKGDYYEAIKDLPIDIVFSICSITIGLENLVHFTGVTGSTPVSKEMLVDDNILVQLINGSEYPGENIFINATPANLEDEYVPRAGEIVYSQEELNYIVKLFHDNGKKIGCHVAGLEAIDMAIEAGFDVIHHGHEMNNKQIQKVIERDILVVATPLGGTHLAPNSPREIVNMLERGITLAISTDGYLPPSKKASWLQFNDNSLKGPESLMLLAHPSMTILKDLNWDENNILQLITLNPAKVLGKDKLYGSLDIGKHANFIVAKSIPGLEITDTNDILKVFYKGEMIIDKQN